MLISKNLYFENLKQKTKIKNLKNIFLNLINEKNETINSLKINYKYSYSKKFLLKFRKFNQINLIGMGGSILGTKAIISFLDKKIKKQINFIDNLNFKKLNKNKNTLNVVISKSGNTLETISNVNIIINKKDKNIFITENTNNYLRHLASKLKSEIINHNNFIGGRYSVLSEVGMLPISLIGFNEKKFKQFNNLIKNKNFINNLINNVSTIFHFSRKKNYNSIVLNYDEKSEDLFKWYQQLFAESLGKKQNGILPVISTMPKDNHSLMQLYLDGPKNNFLHFLMWLKKIHQKLTITKFLKNLNFLKIKIFLQLYQRKKMPQKKFF